jgi:hypothetical protein
MYIYIYMYSFYTSICVCWCCSALSFLAPESLNMYVCACVCMCISIYACVYVYICMYACMYAMLLASSTAVVCICMCGVVRLCAWHIASPQRTFLGFTICIINLHRYVRTVSVKRMYEIDWACPDGFSLYASVYVVAFATLSQLYAHV